MFVKFITLQIFISFLYLPLPVIECGVNLTIGTCVIQYSEICASNYLKFYITTSDYPRQQPYLFENYNFQIPKYININYQFKVIIHGYGGGIDFNQTKHLQKEYLKTNSTNVIAVDWSRLVVLPCYPTAAVNTKQAGECIANFLIQLQLTNPGFQAAQIHLIGFSLGAHVAGFASNSLQKLTGEKIHRITGLDPALPLFITPHNHRKLDSSDAIFVDVIHTNIGYFGKIEPCGHVDFYINGGHIQPNCNTTQNIPLCSHMMAITYMQESILTNIGFWGIRCSSLIQYIFGWCRRHTSNSIFINSDQILMGEKCSQTAHGIVFVYTNLESPYALGSII